MPYIAWIIFLLIKIYRRRDVLVWQGMTVNHCSRHFHNFTVDYAGLVGFMLNGVLGKVYNLFKEREMQGD